MSLIPIFHARTFNIINEKPDMESDSNSETGTVWLDTNTEILTEDAVANRRLTELSEVTNFSVAMKHSGIYNLVVWSGSYDTP